jgi:hypothetical protein
MAVATDTLERVVLAALAEDVGHGDVTTEATVSFVGSARQRQRFGLSMPISISNRSSRMAERSRTRPLSPSSPAPSARS